MCKIFLPSGTLSKYIVIIQIALILEFSTSVTGCSLRIDRAMTISLFSMNIQKYYTWLLRIPNYGSPVTRLGSNCICCYYFPGISAVRGELTMISFSIVFFLPLTLLFNVLCQQSPIPSIYFFYSSTLSRSLLMQTKSQFRSSSS